MKQTRNYITKKKGKTEVYPFWNMSDIKNVVEWFENANDWDGYLITMLELLLGRRIGDTIMMKWSDLYYENGKQREVIDTIEEQKTGKTTNIPVSPMVFETVDEYLKHKNINPISHYEEYIFEHSSKTNWVTRGKTLTEFYASLTLENIDDWCKQLGKDISQKRKENIIEDFKKQKTYSDFGSYLYYEIELNDVIKWQQDSYRKRLNRAVKDCKIEYPVSTHSLRKSFGYWIHKTHPFDPDCLLSLQKLFNHSDLQTTMNYIGLTEEKNRQLIEDHGNFIKNVLEGKGDEIVKNMPVVSLKTNDLNDIIMQVIKNKDKLNDIDIYHFAVNKINEKRII